MSEETPEIEEAEEKPKRRRRSRKSRAEEGAPSAAEASSAAEPPQEPEGGEEPESLTPVAADAEETAPAETEAESEDTDSDEAVAPQAEEEQEPAAREAAEPSARARRTPAPAQAPQRRRGRRELPDVTVRAQAKYVRSSARKARLVCDHIRGKSVDEARAILAHTPRAVARDWSKLLESAVANAEHNHELIGEDLYVTAVRADEGPTIKRYRPRALGRATRIRKRTSHLTILLKPKR